jgi:hypothetical protein
MEVFMPDFAGALGASKAASALLVLFIPSKDRRNKSIDQRYWVNEKSRFAKASEKQKAKVNEHDK